MTFYRALIETRADDSGPEPGEAALESFREAVQPFAGAVSRGSVPRSVSARISVEAVREDIFVEDVARPSAGQHEPGS